MFGSYRGVSSPLRLFAENIGGEEKMKKNMFTKYYLMILVIVFFSIFFAGSFLWLVSKNMSVDEKRTALRNHVCDIVQQSQINYYSGYGFGSEEMKKLYMSAEAVTGISYHVFDENGELVMSSDRNDCNINNYGFQELITDFDESKEYFKISNLNSQLDEMSAYYVSSFDIEESGNYKIIAIDDIEDINRFSQRLSVHFIICIGILIILLSVVINWITRQMLKPIEEMTTVAKSYADGDFSKRVKVEGDDEIAHLAMTLNDMAESIDANEKIRKSFVANVSHELRTPMTTIGGFIDGILDNTIPKEQQRHYMKLVSEEIQRLSRLVRSMLNISKFEAGEMKINYKKGVNITQLAINTMLMFERKIEEKKVNVEGLDGDDVFADVDEDLMQQVFNNLTENAVKFVNDKGTITFNAQVTPENRLRISFKNTGEGLRDDEMPRLFDRFYKTDESRGKDKNGVGLGLSIVRSIVALHQGTITVGSAYGEYTEFLIDIPATEPEDKE